jgi:hypothetical protein
MLRNKKIKMTNFNKCFDAIISYFREIISDKWTTMEDEFNIELRNRINRFINTINKKWSSAGRNLKTFQLKKKIWLSLNFNIFGDVEIIPQLGGIIPQLGGIIPQIFQKFNNSADIKGAHKNVIKRFGNILFAMSSDHEVNVSEFKMYTIDTAKLFISLYPLFFMPSSVHKILIHGADVIIAAILPIGKI